MGERGNWGERDRPTSQGAPAGAPCQLVVLVSALVAGLTLVAEQSIASVASVASVAALVAGLTFIAFQAWGEPGQSQGRTEQ